MAEPWLIRFFACNREMQPFSFFFVGYSAIRWGGGGGYLGSGSGSKFNRAARVGSGWVRQFRVRAGFGLQFWARADLYFTVVFMNVSHSAHLVLKLEKCIPISHVTLETVPKYANIERPTSNQLYASLWAIILWTFHY